MNKTVGADERCDSNNIASVQVASRERIVPVISNLSPEALILQASENNIYLTADVKKYDDILSVSFCIDGTERSSSVSNAAYGNAMRYSCLRSSTNVSVGTHKLRFSAAYTDGGEELTVTKEITMTVRNHDCSLDGHRLVHLAATSENMEYWHCDYCGSLFSDAQGNHEISAEGIVIAPQPFEVSCIGVNGNHVILHIAVPERLNAEHIVIASYHSGKMTGCCLCPAPVTEAIESSHGSNVSVLNGEVIRVFLLDDNYCPLISCVEVTPK